MCVYLHFQVSHCHKLPAGRMVTGPEGVTNGVTLCYKVTFRGRISPKYDFPSGVHLSASVPFGGLEPPGGSHLGRHEHSRY